ncbi:MAG TPA: leucine-rich repeat domain-containing protein, partial [Myxococcaceae bacterium]
MKKRALTKPILRREAKGRDQALKRIHEVARDGTKLLALSSLAIDELPAELFELEQLEELSLYGNDLRTVPEGLEKLPNLQSLDLTRNELTE